MLGQLLEQAPRAPGKKKQDSKSASRARAILRGPKAKLAPDPKNGASLEDAVIGAVAAGAVALEDAVAEAIAVWIEQNWGNGNWDGAPATIPERIRKGEWRSALATREDGGDDDADGQDGPERAVGAVDP